MTDKEIIKALERIAQYSGFTDDVSNTLLCALDLINRQQAEIEKLKKLKCFEIFIDERIHKSNELGLSREFRTKEDYDKAFKKEVEKLYDISTATVEEIKEFAERLKKAFIKCDPMFNRHIDKLVKEMVGED